MVCVALGPMDAQGWFRSGYIPLLGGEIWVSRSHVTWVHH